MDLLALVLAGVFESESRNASGGFFGDDLQALDYSGHDLMLEAGVKALGVFADDDEVHVRIAGRNMGQIADGTKVGVELELLAQGDVDAGKAAADRGGHR